MRKTVGSAAAAGGIILATGCFDSRSAEAAEDEATRILRLGIMEAGVLDAAVSPMDGGAMDSAGVAQEQHGTLALIFTEGAMAVSEVSVTGPHGTDFQYESYWSSSRGTLVLHNIPVNQDILGEVRPVGDEGEILRFAVRLTAAGEYDHMVTPAQLNGQVRFITK